MWICSFDLNRSGSTVRISLFTNQEPFCSRTVDMLLTIGKCTRPVVMLPVKSLQLSIPAGTKTGIPIILLPNLFLKSMDLAEYRRINTIIERDSADATYKYAHSPGRHRDLPAVLAPPGGRRRYGLVPPRADLMLSIPYSPGFVGSVFRKIASREMPGSCREDSRDAITAVRSWGGRADDRRFYRGSPAGK